MCALAALTCPTCGGGVSAAPGAPLTCPHCGNRLIWSGAANPGPALAPAPPDPREEALREELARLAGALLALDAYQASAAVASAAGLPLRTLKAWLAARDAAAPARWIAAATADELARLREQYRGSPLRLSRRRREGLALIDRIIALRGEGESPAPAEPGP